MHSSMLGIEVYRAMNLKRIVPAMSHSGDRSKTPPCHVPPYAPPASRSRQTMPGSDTHSTLSTFSRCHSSERGSGQWRSVATSPAPVYQSSLGRAQVLLLIHVDEDVVDQSQHRQHLNPISSTHSLCNSPVSFLRCRPV